MLLPEAIRQLRTHVLGSEVSHGVIPRLLAETAGRFAVYDLMEDAPPKNFIEAAERGDNNYIVKVIERTLDFNINQTVSV